MYWRKSEKRRHVFGNFVQKNSGFVQKIKRCRHGLFTRTACLEENMLRLGESISADTWNLFRLLWGKNITECDIADETADYNQENGIDFVAVGGDECSGKK